MKRKRIVGEFFDLRLLTKTLRLIACVSAEIEDAEQPAICTRDLIQEQKVRLLWDFVVQMSLCTFECRLGSASEGWMPQAPMPLQIQWQLPLLPNWQQPKQQ
jgi:hypothetical protein